MMRPSAVGFSLLMLLALPVSLWAKGETSMIVIKGNGLETALEISHWAVAQFRVHAGPGVHFRDGVNDREETQGFIIEWPQGITERPSGELRHYEVEFFVGNLANPKLEPCYTVDYDYDPATKVGYVYLPGNSDPRYMRNTGTLYHGHGLEGNWFRATKEWDSFVVAAMRKAAAHEKYYRFRSTLH